MRKIARRLVGATLLGLGGFLCYPFFLIYCGRSDIEYLTFQVIADKSTGNADTDSLRCMRLFQTVGKYFKEPTCQVKDQSVFKILLSEEASCDQQCAVLLTLARNCSIQGRLIFLRGRDSISHHSVCELRIENHFAMFDPFFNNYLINHQNKVAGIEDIQKGNIVKRTFPEDNDFGFSKNSYFALFEPTFQPIVRVSKPQIITSREKWDRKLLISWYDFIGDFGLRYYLKYYFEHNHSSRKFQHRLKKVLELND